MFELGKVASESVRRDPERVGDKNRGGAGVSGGGGKGRWKNAAESRHPLQYASKRRMIASGWRISIRESRAETETDRGGLNDFFWRDGLLPSSRCVLRMGIQL